MHPYQNNTRYMELICALTDLKKPNHSATISSEAKQDLQFSAGVQIGALYNSTIGFVIMF